MNYRRLTGYLSDRSPFPEGSLTVGVGLVSAGLTAYGFLVISGRVLGAERFAELSALWSLIFLVCPGFFLPIEQEVARVISARRARGVGAWPAVRRVIQVELGFVLVLLLGSAAAADLLIRELFDGQFLLFVGLVSALIGFGVQHLARGALSGNERFRRYGLLLGSEGVLRLIGCGVLAAAAVSSSGPYGLVLGLAPFAATAIALKGQRDLTLPGPPAGLREVSGAVGYLLTASLLAQVLINAGPLVIKFLASEQEKAAAGRFLAGLIVARVPLFLFQAVQASLLPMLSSHAASGRQSDFNRGLKRLLATVVVVGMLATVFAAIAGPWVMRLLFGPGFVLTRTDLALLAGASAVYLMAIALSQGLIALSGHARVAIAWLVAVLSFGVVTTLGTGLILRVEVGFLAGSIIAATAMGVLLIPLLRAGPRHSVEELVEASRQVPLDP